LDEFDKSTNDLLVHKSVKSEIRSMYEENIQKAYYTPLRHTKDSFRFTYVFINIVLIHKYKL